MLGLINGMIGGTCLVLPYLSLSAGWLSTTLVVGGIGFLSYYTAALIITHLGKSASIKESILSHFDDDYRYMMGYSLFIWISFVPPLFIYFRIICLQI